MSSISRRGFFGLAGAALLPHTLRAAGRRVAVIDWGILETALALGLRPVAAAELIQYRQLVVEPALPEGISDLGLRGTPNYELLRLVNPDLILISQFYEYQRPLLERIAPVLSLPVYEAGTPPYPIAQKTMQELGDALGLEDVATAYLEATRQDFAARRARLARIAARPIFVISLGDARHFRAFGSDSMLGDVLPLIGLRNAWTEPTSYSAAAPVGIEALARAPDAAIVIVAPLPPDVARTLPRNALWRALPAVQHGRVAVIDPINHFGGIPSARRFARLLEAAAADWPDA